MRLPAALLIALPLTLLTLPLPAPAADPPHPVMRWVKRHPLPDAKNPSPRMGYECAYGYDPATKLLLRYAGHNQGGGGEQNSEMWTYDLAKDLWDLREPNDAPPGVCCGQQNVFHAALGKYVRFPSFSASHGWQSLREVYLKDSSVWTFDVGRNEWRAMRPCPEVWPKPLRGAAYDPVHEVIVLHGGETARHGTVAYDLHANTWHELQPPRHAPEATNSGPGFAYDAVNRVFVLFGSQFDDDPRTWVYDLRKNKWTVLETPTHPPAVKSSPVMAADTRNGVILCTVLPGEEQRDVQTWVLDVKQRTWTRLDLKDGPDNSGARNRNLVYLPDQNLFVLENRTHGDASDEQQVWTFRYADAAAPPAAPARPQVMSENDAAVLRWEKDGRPFDVYRAAADRPWQSGFARVAEGVTDGTFRDTGVKTSKAVVYQIRAAGDAGGEGPPSPLAHARPAVPLMPVVSVASPKRLELAWEKSPEPDVVGYTVERAPVSVYSVGEVLRVAKRYRSRSDLAVARVKRIGQFVPVTKSPIAEPRYADESADLAAGQQEPAEPWLVDRELEEDNRASGGKPYRFAVYAYRVRAVNRLGVASGPSPYALSIPSAVQHVFSKEVGDTSARVRWKPNAERALKGYLVYRHDGRWEGDEIVRLTPEPITATEFEDRESGTETRRYEVVAVDALGQEGEPSQPVWSRREWAKYYEPFVGEWHQ